MSNSKCVICLEECGEGDTSCLHWRGIDTLVQSAEKRRDVELVIRLSSDSGKNQLRVHNSCRKRYTDKRALESIPEDEEGVDCKRLRSSISEFDWKRHCLVCAEPAVADPRHPERCLIKRVETLDMRQKILEKCDDGDNVTGPIKTRIQDCIDLVAVEARYHHQCLIDLLHHESSEKLPGRPVDEEREESFQLLCEWLEAEAEIYSVSEIHSKMKALAIGDEVFSEKYLRVKLQQRYGDHVFFAKMGGSRKDVVCFRNMAGYIISDKWYNERQNDATSESHRILRDAGKLALEEIRAMSSSKDMYPSVEDFTDVESAMEFVPKGVRIFLESVVKDDLKRASIGQAITQAARPRSTLSPILFGVGVEFHHMFGSEWAVNQLHSLGYSVSYDEVTRYRQSVLQEQTLESMSSPPNLLAQFGADNVDSNIRTLDGGGTFHAMALFSWYKKGGAGSPRVKRAALVKVDQLLEGKKIPVIKFVTSALPALSSPTQSFVPIQDIYSGAHTESLPGEYYASLLWRTSFLHVDSSSNDPHFVWTNWSGFMQQAHRNAEPNVDQTNILPIIDLNPNDYDCILSTLTYVSDQARRLGIPSTSVTFDQPLFIKAYEVVTTKKITNVVVRIGGFHLLMSVTASLYGTMRGSGLENALGQIYATNSLPLILSGKAISRAVRAMRLLNAALHQVIVKKMIASEACDDDGDSSNEVTELMKDLLSLYESVIDEQMQNPMDLIASSPSLKRLDEKLAAYKEMVSSTSRTSKLWVQFIDYIQVIDAFILSERIGHWHGHLKACSKMLNLLAGTGHVHYAKSARLYLQSMLRLEEDHPWLYAKFVEDGNFAVQRSSHAFNGLWPDLVIEQVVMASIKNSHSGLTHGRGLTESVRQQWIYSLHMFASVHDAMCRLTGRRRCTSEQHVDTGHQRRSRDTADVAKLCDWLVDHDPFTDYPSLRSLSTGLVDDGNDLNCDECEIVGHAIQSQLDNKPYNDAKVKRKSQIRTLQELEAGVVVDNKRLHIDPRVLFGRLGSVIQRQDLKTESFLEYEMSASPPALFDGDMMRKSDKSELGRFLLSHSSPTRLSLPLPQSVFVIIDGGWLLHRVRWSKKSTYQEIVTSYSAYIRKKFDNVVVIFDGYDGPSTKDHEHRRRMAKKISATIDVKLDRTCQNDQASFLANDRNKSQLISLISSQLMSAGHVVKQTGGDADCEIAKTALDFAKEGNHAIVLVEDCDVLVMLVHHFDRGMADIEVCKFPKRSTEGELYSVNKIVECLDPSVKPALLFAHAWSGCDTTSGTFNQGKMNIVKLLKKHPGLRQINEDFNQSDQSPTVIQSSGERVFCHLYGQPSVSSILQLRCAKYNEKKDDITTLDPRKLPPSPGAAQCHSYRVYLQVQRWKLLDYEALDSENWGWSMGKDCLNPMMSTRTEIAPSFILKCIRCKCKGDSRLQCASGVCSCKKLGLRCVSACGGCHGETCQNTQETDIQTDLD